MQLWNVCNDDVYDHNVMNCTYTNDLKHDSQMLHVDPHVGNQSVGFSVADPDNKWLIAENTTRGSQNDSKHPMNLQNHMVIIWLNLCMIQLVPYTRESGKCDTPITTDQDLKIILFTSLMVILIQTQLCTVQFFNRYLEGTDISNHVVFL